jgi:hypothetical protein
MDEGLELSIASHTSVGGKSEAHISQAYGSLSASALSWGHSWGVFLSGEASGSLPLALVKLKAIKKSWYKSSLIDLKRKAMQYYGCNVNEEKLIIHHFCFFSIQGNTVRYFSSV